MRSLLVSFICFLSFFAMAKSGSSSGGAKRGGVGFLFQDFNGFSNPAQKALFRGFAAQVAYDTTLNTGTKSLTPSLVWGKGSFGLGGFVTRSGSDLSKSNSSTDSLGGALGLGFAANRITLGAGFARSVDEGQNMDGVLSLSANLNGLGGKGFHLGASLSTTIHRAVREIRSGVAGIGWGFGRTAIEVDYFVSDFQDPGTSYEAAGYLTWEGELFFLGLGYGYEKAIETSFGAGRLGLKFGKWDLSASAQQSFAIGSNANVGAALRLKF